MKRYKVKIIRKRRPFVRSVVSGMYSGWHQGPMFLEGEGGKGLTFREAMTAMKRHRVLYANTFNYRIVRGKR